MIVSYSASVHVLLTLERFDRHNEVILLFIVTFFVASCLSGGAIKPLLQCRTAAATTHQRGRHNTVLLVCIICM